MIALLLMLAMSLLDLSFGPGRDCANQAAAPCVLGFGLAAAALAGGRFLVSDADLPGHAMALIVVVGVNRLWLLLLGDSKALVTSRLVVFGQGTCLRRDAAHAALRVDRVIISRGFGRVDSKIGARIAIAMRAADDRVAIAADPHLPS
jgi:hypothetical protein